MAASPDSTTLRIDGSSRARHTLVLAPGAGAPADSPFLNAVAEGLAGEAVRVVRFDFPYMGERLRTGRRRPPDRAPVLLAVWQDVVARLGGGPGLVIGGKSMGGRMASLVADGLGVRGLVCLGYPFHPTGRPERLRTAHLEALATPTLILQGTRDPLGTPEEVSTYELSPRIRVRWLEDGDHSWKPRKRSGRTEAQNLAEAIEAILEFLEALPEGARTNG